MPELNIIHIVIIAALTVIGAIVGWIMRSRRADEEKAAVSAGWKEQLRAKDIEHDRLTDQNKGLMEQNNQYQASNKDAKNRAKELSEAVQEAYARRDELQREIKDIRGNLEKSLSERDQLQSDISAKASEVENDGEILAAKDARIKKLQSELGKWQSRVPPLIEKFRQRNEDAEKLEAELTAANARIQELENLLEHGQTRIEPVRDPESLTNGRDASNDSTERDTLGDTTTGVRALSDENALTSIDDEDDRRPRDRLQDIKGIGPAIEKTLNEMGIFTFQQIAEMSEYDINRVAKQLKGFRSRIYREDWIGQAREFRDQSNNG